MTAPLTAPNPFGRTFTVERRDPEVSPLDTYGKVIYLGGPKDGKTYLLGSWNENTLTPGQPGVFVISFDPNLGTIRQFDPPIPYVQIDNTEQFRKHVFPWILSGGLASEYPSVTTIAVDSLSFYAKMLELETTGDWQLFAQRIAGDLGQLTRLANRNAGIPRNYNLVASCHEKDRYTSVKTNNGRERHLVGVEPAVAGQMAALLTGYFDLVLYAKRKTEAVLVPGSNPPRYENTAVFECAAMEPPQHKAPAGGTLWGRSITGKVDGTYKGLHTLCGG